MITTVHEGLDGEMDEAVIQKTEGEIDNDNEHTTWVEYRCPCHGEIVHRSVHVTLKKLPQMFGEIGEI